MRSNEGGRGLGLKRVWFICTAVAYPVVGGEEQPRKKEAIVVQRAGLCEAALGSSDRALGSSDRLPLEPKR